MASSGSISTNKYTFNSGKTLGLKLSWSIKSQSIANNTSTLSWTLQCEGTYPSGYTVKAGPVTATINGTKVVNTTSRFDMEGGGKYKKTGTITITHTADGSKTFSASVKAAIYSASVNCTKSGSWALTQINRYALITGYPNFTDEENPTITYSNPGQLATNIQARLKWLNADGVTEETTAWSSELGVEGGTYTFDLSSYRSQLRAACPNSNTLSVTYDVKSILDEVEYHDTKTATMNIVNANPTIASNTITYLDTDPTTVAKTGNNNQIIVQNQGVLRINIDTTKVAALKSATIAEYALHFNGGGQILTTDGNIKYTTISQPNVAGSVPVDLFVFDSRGNDGHFTLYIPICELSAPSASYTLTRENNFDTNTTLLVNALYSSISNTNALTITAKYKQVGASSWAATVSVPNGSPGVVLPLTKEFDWDVEILLADEYYTSDDQTVTYHKTVYDTVVSKGKPLVFFDKLRHSVSVNGFPDANNQFYVEGTVKSTGMVTCPSMSWTEITDQYTITKTSGNWTVLSYNAFRCGNIIQFGIKFKGNGNAVSSGSNGWVGTLSGGPLPLYEAKITGFYSGGWGCFNIASNADGGGCLARVCGGTSITLSSSSGFGLSGTFICVS